jgi:hypothetical protein
MNKIEKLLSQRTQSPTPHLQADPFLATKITTLANENTDNISVLTGTKWSFASIITAFGILMGIYLGLGIWENNTSATNNDIVDEFSEAFYQSGFADNFDSTVENGDN